MSMEANRIILALNDLCMDAERLSYLIAYAADDGCRERVQAAAQEQLAFVDALIDAVREPDPPTQWDLPTGKGDA